ncbi:hypothetical protein NESM_000042000 [Novymonas esmeraldas]|uniref:Uncharacterized protein n=1 Tax=Novymonas esmeraldas TaxID=1808958 RepID=A0AAW0F0B1_9TRYP
MEAVFYNHATTSTAARRDDLRRALQAFLADAASRSAVHLIGLFVRIPTPSTVTAASAKSAKRSAAAQKLAWCAKEADRRLHDASEDAAELNSWIVHGELGARARPRAPRAAATAVSGISVVPVAFLEPHTRDDLTVYESWQRCAEVCTGGAPSRAPSRATQMFSPLRHASLVALSLGSPSLLLSWTARSSPCHLDSLLLPHQSLLLDMSWWVDPTHGDAADAVGRVSAVALRDVFVHDVQPCLRLPKGDSRCALWIAYAVLTASLHPDTSSRRRGGGGGGGGAGEEEAAAAGAALAATYKRLRELLSSLHVSDAGGAVGRTRLLRVLLGYGGPSAALHRELVRSRGLRDAVAQAPVDAALLQTRSLVDIHALFGVLAGQESVNMYSEAAAFVRTARRRASAGRGSQQRHQRVAIQSSRVQVAASPPSPSPNAASGTPPPKVAVRDGGCTFVEHGAKMLARKLRLLERKRLGKTSKRGDHVRPRTKAARRVRRQLRTQDSGADQGGSVLARAVERAGRAPAAKVATAKAPRAGVKRRREAAPPQPSSTATTAPPLSKQRRAEAAPETPSAPRAGDTALSWSEDVAGGG